MFAKRSLLALFTVAAAMAAAPASANEYLSLNVGEFNALRTKDNALQYGIEYRGEELKYNLHPILGAFGTSDGSAYAYAGLNWDITILPQQLYLIPNFAVGAYRKGGGRDLGGTLEFRSGIELDYQFTNQHRLGVALNHLSNASIYDRNPGEESVLVTYSVPLNSVSNLIGGQ